MLKKFLVVFYFIVAIFLPILVMAIDFKPSIDIPNSKFTATTTITPSSLAEYIVAIYRYGGMFAGVVAMFMLVYAGWEWLLAGGNSSKISRARDKINSVLIGLALLCGGYILLSLISQRLVSFEPLDRDLPKLPCSVFTSEKACPAPSCIWVAATPEQIISDPKFVGVCMDTSEVAEQVINIDCDTVPFPSTEETTGSSGDDENMLSCSYYPSTISCDTNACFGENYKDGTSPLNEVCYLKDGVCENLWLKSCDKNSDCQIENNPDSRTWCCENISFQIDRCAPIGGLGGIDASRCGDD